MRTLQNFFGYLTSKLFKDNFILLRNNHVVLYYFAIFFLFFFFVGVLASLFFFGFSLYEFKEHSICFKPGCLSNFLEFHSDAIKVLNWTIGFLVSYSTIGAIVVALLTYLNSVSSTALGTHISHFKVFQDYLSFELVRNNKLSISSINSLQWYNMIFSKSRLGSTSVSDSYKDQIAGINKLISESNDKADRARNGSFSYKEHQGKMIRELKNIGIRLERAPRNDFYAIENEIFALICAINVEFCTAQGIPILIERKYI